MMTRRRFLQGLFGLAAAGVGTVGYMRYIEPQWVEYVKRPLPIPNLPANWQGKTLVQISDLHVGKRFDWRTLLEPLKKVNEFAPDMVVYTGDFVSYRNEEQYDELSVVMQDAPLGRVATLAVLGNHDYGYSWGDARVADEIVRRIEAFGITVLRNETVTVDDFHITGLDDFWGTNFAPIGALASLSAEQANLVLCHNPDVADLPIWGEFNSWILAGHTHGGQLKPPFLPAPVVPVWNKAYTAGHFDLGDGRHMYINRALGHAWPVRFNVRPEITVFTLERA